VSYRESVAATIADAATRREAWLADAPDGLRDSVPLDATGVTEAIALLARAVGVEDEIAALQSRAHRANPAVLHGRVYGRVPLAQDTVLAAFADGARVRRAVIARLAEAIDGRAFRAEIEEQLGAEPDAADELPALREIYAAQEAAVLACAVRLDELAA
jgi:hypothetical protein